ncbi:MAG: hypothetical protein FWC10_02695 [Lentimicrobiaceae bacterium]|nr:hypothetical protein [Lentimicrobiaceae bacterium]
MKNKLKVIPLLLSAFCFLLSAVNAQIEKKELKLTPEMKKIVLTEIQDLSEKDYAEYGITDRSQLMNLHLGEPIPKYRIVNKKLQDIDISNVFHRLSEGESISLRFQNDWTVPVMSDESPLLFRNMRFADSEGNNFGGNYILSGTKNIIEHFHNYEYKDSIIGSVTITSSTLGMDDLLIIRKENQDVFVQVYDDATGEYFKNEYRFSELLNLLKDLHLRAKEARRRYYDKIANKSELKITPEITRMLINQAYSFLKNRPDESLSDWGIKDSSQLEHLHLGKPISLYRIVDENLTFLGYWEVPVMSDGKPLYFTTVYLEDDDQYQWGGASGAEMAEIIHNYEYKDFITGFLEVISIGIRGSGYLIIRKDNQDTFVQMYDYTKGEYLKNEYSFQEVLNLLKK